MPDGELVAPPANGDGPTAVESLRPVGTESQSTELAFPKPLPQFLEREERRLCQQARERRENTAVRKRSGGRCEVVLGGTRCRKPGREVHHLLGGHGRRGRGVSVRATHKVQCVEHHRLISLRWIDVTWTTPENPIASLTFRQVRGQEVG